VSTYPIKLSSEGGGYRVSIIDGSDGLSHSRGVYAPSAETALACVATLLGVPSKTQVSSPVLDAMRKVLGR
jgi:hypothetical protein